MGAIATIKQRLGIQVNRSQFERTAKVKIGGNLNWGFHADLEGPQGRSHGCGHDIYENSLAKTLYAAVNFCDKKGILITDLDVSGVTR